jgi:hypothetical protein
MKKLASLFAAVVVISSATACSTSSPQSTSTTAPGHGAVAIQIAPNPIVARQVSGDTYDFPFEVIVRETGGHAVEIQRVSATVRGPGGFALGSESWDAARIRSMGYSPSIGANGELRYRFAPRKEVPDDRLFGSVAAELRVEGTDGTGTPTVATTTVTITR